MNNEKLCALLSFRLFCFQLLIIHYSLIIKKGLYACKPDSVSRRVGGSTEPTSTTGLHGLTIRKVYPPGMSPCPGCALLPHIFTLSTTEAVVVIFCGTVSWSVWTSPDVIGMRRSALSGLSSPGKPEAIDQHTACL